MKDIFYPVAHRSQELIDKFKTRYDDFDESLIPDIVYQALGLRPAKVTRSTSWGSAHVIYFLSFKDRPDLVFRANISMPDPEVVMLTEKIITDLVAAEGILTNRILHVDVSRAVYPFDYQIQEKLGGIDPEDEFRGTEEEYAQFTFETGQAIAKMQDIELEGFGRFDETIAQAGKLQGSKTKLYDYLLVCLNEDLDSLGQMALVTALQAEAIAQFFAERQRIINIKQGTLVHYDLADHNLRYENGHLVGIFDWETAVVASPVLDLASCPTWKSHYSKRKKLLEGYQSIRSLPNDFEELEKVFTLRTALWKMRYAVNANIVTDARKEFFQNTLQSCLT